MTAAVCEYDKAILEQITSHLKKSPYITKLFAFSDYEILKAEIEEHANPDLIFMDLDCDFLTAAAENEGKAEGRLSGVRLAEEIQAMSPLTRVIYVTAYPEYYATRLFLHSVNISGILNKPLDMKLLDLYLKHIRQMLDQEVGQSIVIHKRNRDYRVRIADICYLEIVDHRLSLILENEVVDAYQSLRDMQQYLPKQFVRIHRSYLVNLEYLQGIQRSGAVVQKSSGETLRLPVGRVYFEKARAAFELWMESHGKT